MATTPDEAAALQEAGVNAIAASGFEAGGHRGSFLRAAEDSLTGTLSLVPQVVDIVDVPVIAAGGIADARGVIAALALGGRGRPNGNGISGVRGIRRQPTSSRDFATTQRRTYCFDQRVHRKTRAGNQQPCDGGPEPNGTEILPYPLQRELVRNLAIAAEAAGRADLIPMWAGQSANLSTCTDVSAFLTSLVEEVSEIAGPIIQWSAARRERQILK